MNYRGLIDEKKISLSLQQADLSTLRDRRERLEKDSSDVEGALNIARKAAILVQDSLATKLSGIVTKALATVFDEDVQFVAEFVERRGVSECDLYLKDGDGNSYSILDSRGGGLADVCSVCLQMSFILLSDVDRVLIVDEIARHVDGEAQEKFASVLKQLCQELGFTIITVTHSSAFVEAADRVFKVNMKRKVSYVEQQ